MKLPHDEERPRLSKEQHAVLNEGYHQVKNALDRRITTMRDYASYFAFRADGKLPSQSIDEISTYFRETGLSAKDLFEIADFVDLIAENNIAKLKKLRARQPRNWWDILRVDTIRKLAVKGMANLLQEQERRYLRIDKRCQNFSTLARMAAVKVMEKPVSRASNSLQ